MRSRLRMLIFCNTANAPRRKPAEGRDAVVGSGQLLLGMRASAA